MQLAADTALQKKLINRAYFLAGTVLLIAVLALAGWWFDIPVFRRPIPNLTAMNPLSAAGLIFSGFALFMFRSNSTAKISAGKFLSALVFFIGLFKILHIIFNFDFDIDNFLFGNKLLQESEAGLPNRMAPTTSVCFVLTGVSLFLLNSHSEITQKTVQIFVLFTGLIGLLSILGYTYQVQSFYGVFTYIPMAIHTALCMLFLSVAILFSNPGKGIMKDFTSHLEGSITARLLIPAAIIVPVLLGLLLLMAKRAGIFTEEFGAALLVLSIVIVFLGIAWYNTVLLNKRDIQRLVTENALRENEEQLQTLFTTAPDAIVVINDEGKIVKWNKQAETLFGWLEEEVIGKLLSETIIPLRFREAHRKGLNHFLRTGEGPLLGKLIETCAVLKNGNEIDIALNISVTNKIKNSYLFIGFIRDITDKKKAEEKFRSLLESAPDAMVIVNEKGEIVLVNHQTEVLFGYKKIELMGQRVEMLVPYDFRDKHVEHRGSYFHDPRVRSMGVGIELFALRKDGSQFPVEISLSPIETSEGLLVSAAIRDITERKKSEEKFKGLLESAPDAMIIANEEGNIVLVNHQTEALFGYTKEELINQKVETLVPGQFQNIHRRHRASYFKDPKVRAMGAGFELYAVRKDGTQFPVEISLSPLETSEGILVSAAIRDTTERRQIQAIIQKQNQEIQDFIDSMSTLCAKVATDGKLMLVNRTALQATGLSLTELMSTNFLDGHWWAYKSEVHARVCDAFKKACSGTEINYDENIFAFGRELTINFSLIPIMSVDGEVEYIVAEGRDITSLKFTEAELQKQTDQLEKTIKELEAFSYSVSHDLRAPLRIIDGYTEIILSDYGNKLDEEGKKSLDVVSKNVRKMGQLIDDLLDLSRLGRKELIVHHVDMTRLVKSVIKEQISAKTKRYKINISPLEPADCDSNLIRQVWINLISNAIKYSSIRDNPLIEISSVKSGNEIVYSIKDNGVGFNMQYAGKLFGVFQRLHKMTEFEGTGVGLALVHRIITRHNGRVWAEAETDKGATFFFSLPCMPDRQGESHTGVQYNNNTHKSIK